MSVYMIRVLMRGDQNLEAFEQVSFSHELTGDLMRFFCRDLFPWGEGLHEVLVCPSAFFAVKLLRHCHLLLGMVGIEVVAGYVTLDHLSSLVT